MTMVKVAMAATPVAMPTMMPIFGAGGQAAADGKEVATPPAGNHRIVARAAALRLAAREYGTPSGKSSLSEPASVQSVMPSFQTNSKAAARGGGMRLISAADTGPFGTLSWA